MLNIVEFIFILQRIVFKTLWSVGSVFRNRIYVIRLLHPDLTINQYAFCVCLRFYLFLTDAHYTRQKFILYLQMTTTDDLLNKVNLYKC